MRFFHAMSDCKLSQPGSNIIPLKRHYSRCVAQLQPSISTAEITTPARLLCDNSAYTITNFITTPSPMSKTKGCERYLECGPREHSHCTTENTFSLLFMLMAAMQPSTFINNFPPQHCPTTVSNICEYPTTLI